MTAEYIYTHESIYKYLLSYFLPDLSDHYFRQVAAQEIEQDERMTYCRYMAAWLPHEPYYKEILRNLKSLSIERSTRQQASASSYLLSIPSCDDFSLTVIDVENRIRYNKLRKKK